MDIKDLYVNIPVGDTLLVNHKLLKDSHMDKSIIKEIMPILRMILNQNYFQYNEKYYKPRTGVAMGCPLSSTMAEIVLQDMEQSRIKHLL